MVRRFLTASGFLAALAASFSSMPDLPDTPRQRAAWLTTASAKTFTDRLRYELTFLEFSVSPSNSNVVFATKST